MYESRVAADHLTVAAVEGFPPEIDALAACNLSNHGFLRAQWYAAGAQGSGRTLLIRRGQGDASEVIAAIPTISFGPVIGRARKVPGSYWPLRSPLIARDCDVSELAHGLEHGAAYSLGPVWRVGPVRLDDASITLLVAATQLTNWTVLSRPAGTSWVVDCEAARAGGHPRPSVAKKLRAAWRKLAAVGTPHWREVRGAAWDAGVFADMGRIEAQSWIARTTDGSGAKFMTAAQRAVWQHAVSDPAIAKRLSATILMLDQRPIAFTFDLDDGPVRYGIAGSYVEDLKRCNIGKLANYRALDHAVAAGQRVLDLGVGDTGYKEEMGAVEGYRMADLLFVRSRTAAKVLASAWGSELGADEPLVLPEKVRADV
jgi:CelD/BcsL family acetyltransferase involved in cellulose biosynthesis